MKSKKESITGLQFLIIAGAIIYLTYEVVVCRF